MLGIITFDNFRPQVREHQCARARAMIDLSSTIYHALFPALAERRPQLASSLSGGQQQAPAVAQGMIAEPKLQMLDEPTGGLTPLVIDRILDVARALARRGVAVLLSTARRLSRVCANHRMVCGSIVDSVKR